jgi:uncharacterized protein (TIGR02145 family)
LPQLQAATEDYATSSYYYQPTQEIFDDYGIDYNVGTYGLYYSRAAALAGYNGSGTNTVQGICPTGWHIPSSSEWETLINEINDCPNSQYGCGVGKLVGGYDWDGVDYGGNYTSPDDFGYSLRNSTGFNALPAGGCDASDVSMNTFKPGHDAVFWSSSYDGDDTYYFRIYYWDEGFYIISREPYYAASVRCVRDAE